MDRIGDVRLQVGGAAAPQLVRQDPAARNALILTMTEDWAGGDRERKSGRRGERNDFDAEDVNRALKGRTGKEDEMRIGFLGLGKMGTAMALRLMAAGHELAVWNRTEGRTKPLIREGAIAAATPAEAELGADAVITMLFDDAAHEEVLFGANGLMDALSPGALHISCSTISVALSERLTEEHAKRGIDFVAAPVFGRPNIAEEGRLWIVVAGAEKRWPERGRCSSRCRAGFRWWARSRGRRTR